MKPTGYALLALAALLCGYVGLNHLVYDVAPVERAGAGNAAGQMGPAGYWFALIPAAGAAAVGLYMVLIRERGYAADYDMRDQQTPWHA